MGLYGLEVAYIHYIPIPIMLIPPFIISYTTYVSIIMLVHLIEEEIIEEEKIVLLVEF